MGSNLRDTVEDFCKLSQMLLIFLVKTFYLQNSNVKISSVDLFVPRGIRSVNLHDPKSKSLQLVDVV